MYLFVESPNYVLKMMSHICVFFRKKTKSLDKKKGKNCYHVQFSTLNMDRRLTSLGGPLYRESTPSKSNAWGIWSLLALEISPEIPSHLFLERPNPKGVSLKTTWKESVY